MPPKTLRVLHLDPLRASVGPLVLGGGFEVLPALEVEAALDEVAQGACDALVLELADPEGCPDDEALALVRLLRRRAEAAPLLVVADAARAELCAALVRQGASDWVDRAVLPAAGPDVLGRALRYGLERLHLLQELERSRMLGLHLAHHDTLTDLPNRQLFRSRLRQRIALARRHPTTLAVLFLDLDRFKDINDTLGHNVGDRILQEVARRLKRCIRETDTAARRGGDEFTVILDGVERGQDAARVARKILAALGRPFVVDGRELFVGASIGISMFPADGADVDTLVTHADIAMYRAKSRGGNNLQFFLPDMNDRALERLEMERRLRQALERDELLLHYQPIVDLEAGRLHGVEALVRWCHPDLGMVGPDDFIPLAEDTGLVVPMGAHVLAMACAQARAWQDAGFPPMTMAVNVSARQFQQRGLVEGVRKQLEASGLEARWLTLELTESAVMKDPSFAIDALQELRELGVSVAIDDFGTGHSSLAKLKRFPITHLKIDRSFVRTLLTDPRDAAITQAIVHMAHSLGLRAVAEGVERENQLAFLRERGCDEVQGYLLGRPLPAEELEALLEDGLAVS